jgi:thioredoxin-related protein
VDGIESEHTGKLLVLRVDVQDTAGKVLAQEYVILATPTFILFDGQGAELWRSFGRIDPEQVAATLSNLQK